MLRPSEFARLWRINAVVLKFGLNRKVLGERRSLLRLLSYFNPYSYGLGDTSRGEAIRTSLEHLGPIFVKFGQLLSTRRDLLPDDIADELEKLQDRVPPFAGKQARALIEAGLEKPIEALFATFDTTPLASASIAQVHAATLFDGSDVVVKVLRPGISKTIRQDLRLMYRAARFAERFWRHGKRLRPIDFVREFETTIIDEMDLAREAANASQLRRNFETSPIMYVPKIYWQYVSPSVLVMERIYGVRISDMPALQAANTNLKVLAENGVEIFFTQVLRDSFFHADMHPGNIFVDIKDPQHPRYLGVDFGIMGTLSPEDQHYLAANLLAFFKRDYRQVAVLHVESGWVPADTRIDQFEAAIRTVCEPIFQRPLKDISFGKLLLQLFRTAERFDMVIQPQLMLLQKTLLSVEGLGRQLYPDLDLWETAKPFLEKWTRKQHGLLHLAQEVVQQFPGMAEKLLKAPEDMAAILAYVRQQQKLAPVPSAASRSTRKPRSTRTWFGAGIAFLSATLLFYAAPTLPWQWLGAALGVGCLIISALR